VRLFSLLPRPQAVLYELKIKAPAKPPQCRFPARRAARTRRKRKNALIPAWEGIDAFKRPAPSTAQRNPYNSFLWVGRGGWAGLRRRPAHAGHFRV
jgi:hypothetical protein